MPFKPTPEERSAAKSAEPITQEVMKIRVLMSHFTDQAARILQRVDNQISRAGGLDAVTAELGADAASFGAAYDTLRAACLEIDTYEIPERTRDRSTDVAANQRRGILPARGPGNAP